MKTILMLGCAVLCATAKARFGRLAGTPRHRILLTARHHCSGAVFTFNWRRTND